MRFVLIVGVLAACATGNVPGNNPGGGDDGSGPDASTGGPDAATPDAPPGPPQEVTLQQTAEMMPSTNGVFCGNALGDISAQRVYRVFALADHQITGPFHVTKVSFGVYQTNNSPVATVKVGSYGGAIDGNTLNLAQITAIASRDVTVTGNSVVNKIVDVPVTADLAAGSKLVVEISVPSNGAGPQLILGVNTSTETATGYIRSTPCTDTTPVSLAMWGSPTKRPLISVTGTK